MFNTQYRVQPQNFHFHRFTCQNEEKRNHSSVVLFSFWRGLLVLFRVLHQNAVMYRIWTTTKKKRTWTKTQSNSWDKRLHDGKIQWKIQTREREKKQDSPQHQSVMNNSNYTSIKSRTMQHSKRYQDRKLQRDDEANGKGIARIERGSVKKKPTK